MTSWRMAAAWVVALVAATVLTWQIVGLADSQVGERPAAVAPTISTATGESTTTTTTIPTSTSPTAAGPTTTTIPGATTSTSTSGSTSSTSTSSASTSSTTDAAWSLRTVTTIGGAVVVRYRPGEVELQAATPVPGFSVEIDDPGPPRVRVEFESVDTEVRVEVRWVDGALDVDVDVDED